MRLYQATFTAVILSIILSACGGGSAVEESGQQANMTDQETAVSNGNETTTTPAEDDVTSNEEPVVEVVTPPTPTTTQTPVTQTPVTSTPVETEPADTSGESETAEQASSSEPAEAFGPATLTSATVSEDNVILNWNQTKDVPQNGYKIVIDDVVAQELGNIRNTTVTVGGLDLSVQHCFKVKAIYAQADPVLRLSSNALCTEARQSANEAPVISGDPTISVDAGGSYTFTPSATDSDNDDLTFSISNRPSWAQFNSQTGRLSGSPSADDVGDYSNIVITVSDGTDEASLNAFAITVNPDAAAMSVSGSISLNWVAPTTRTDGSALNLSEIQGYCIYLGTTRDNLEMVADINLSNQTSYVVEDLDVGDYYVAVTVYDQAHNMSGFSNIVMKTAMN
jgi:hypothetical protein